MSSIDQWFPQSGSCALCGDPDARHRMFDAIRSRYAAGEPVHKIAADYDVTPGAIYAVAGNGGVDE